MPPKPPGHEPFPQSSWRPTYKSGIKGVKEHPVDLFPKEQDLTTRVLWECASCLDEIGQALRLDDDIASRDPDLNRLLGIKIAETPYGLPWTLANHMCGSAGTTALLFLIAVDIATNPPLPFLEPIVALSWESFYPPSRFTRAYKVIAENSYLHEIGARNADVSWVRDIICKQSGLLYGKLGSSCRDHGDVTTLLNADEEIGFLNAVACVSHKLMDVRHDDPISLVYPRVGRAVFGRETAEAIQYGMCFNPLISDATDGMYTAVGFTSQDAAKYLTTCIKGNFTEQFVSATGEYDLSLLPVEHRGGHRIRFSWEKA